MLTLSRSDAASFNQDDVLLASTFAIQASIALENARLYDDLNRFNQMMERMVEQRVDELSNAHNTLKKLDKNKSDFIQVAAHELRTPLTVIKGYMGMLKGSPAIQNDSLLAGHGRRDAGHRPPAPDRQQHAGCGPARKPGSQPASGIVRSGPLLRLIQKDYVSDLAARKITLELDPEINSLPPILADSELLKKAWTM
jgi:hypothetical protein